MLPKYFGLLCVRACLDQCRLGCRAEERTRKNKLAKKAKKEQARPKQNSAREQEPGGQQGHARNNQATRGSNQEKDKAASGVRGRQHTRGGQGRQAA